MENQSQNQLLPEVEKKIITLRNQQVILDADVAKLYGVETKRINEAVSNNPEKFPDGYILELSESEKVDWSKISTGSIDRNIPLQNQKPLLKKDSICWPQY